MIYSATYGEMIGYLFTFSKICLGLSIMIAVSLIDLNFIKKHAYLFYLIVELFYLFLLHFME